MILLSVGLQLASRSGLCDSCYDLEKRETERRGIIAEQMYVHSIIMNRSSPTADCYLNRYSFTLLYPCRESQSSNFIFIRANQSRADSIISARAEDQIRGKYYYFSLMSVAKTQVRFWAIYSKSFWLFFNGIHNGR